MVRTFPSSYRLTQAIAIIRLHRASWVQTELFLTFPPPTIGAISLIPLQKEETAGRFRVWLSIPGIESPRLMWDRKVEGGFPELKVLVSIASPQSYMMLKSYSRNSAFATNYSLVNRWDIQTSFSLRSCIYLLLRINLVSGF